MAAPTFVTWVGSVFNTSTTPKTLAVSVQAGDRMVVMSQAESSLSGAVTTAPTGGSETYTQIASLTSGNQTQARAIAWSVTCASTQSYSVSCVKPATGTVLWGCQCWIWRDSDGFGAVGAPTVGSTSNSVTLTTTQANSGLCIGSADWNAANGASRTARTINGSTGTEDVYGRDAAAYTWYGQHYLDAGSIGSVTGGYSAPTGQQSAIIAVEVKGTAGGAPALPPYLIMQTRRPY